MLGKEIQVYRKAESQPMINGKIKRVVISRTDILYIIISFLLSRATLLGKLSPFGVSYFAASFQMKNAIFGMLSVLFGAFTAGAGIRSIQYGFSMAVFFIFELTLNSDRRISKLLKSACVGAANFVCCIAIVILNKQTVYSLLVGFLEGVLIFLVTLLLINIDSIEKQSFQKLKIVNEKEMFGTVALFALSVCGLTDVVDFGAVNICEIIWSMLVLVFANGGAIIGGLGTGITVGIISAMVKGSPLSVVALYSICGLGAGFAKNGGKILVAAVYLLLGAAFGVSETVFMFGQMNLLNMLIASLLYLLLPIKFYEKHFAFDGDSFTPFQQKSYMSRMNTRLQNKLESFSGVFNGLTDTIERLSDKKAQQFKVDYTVVQEEAVSKVCKNCGMCVYCWDKDSEKTHESFEKLFSRLKNRGHAEAYDFDPAFRKRCSYADALCIAMNHSYALHRLNTLWNGQLCETRKLLGRQYAEFAGVMKTVAKDITQKIACENTFKSKLETTLLSDGYSVLDVYLYERDDLNYDVELRFDERTHIEFDKIEDLVSKCMERRMRISVIDEYCDSVRLEPKYKFLISTSIATVKKDGEAENGDNYAVFNIKDNRCVIMLSDGMGSGKRACEESRATVNMLKNLLTVGFKLQNAVELVNTALVLKGGTESFATIDLVMVDLLTGAAEFVKIGAANSYVKHKKSVTVIPCAGMPIGILTDIEMKSEYCKLTEGDCIILVSDGVDDGKISAAGLSKFIDNLSRADTEDMAKKLLHFAIENRNGKADDMTVIVAKIVDEQNCHTV